MEVKLIVARGANGAIGKDNDLIWKLPRDMRFFTETTKGSIVVMGRKNWDSIPVKYRPLVGRENVVITRNSGFSHPDCKVFSSIEESLHHYAEDQRDLYVIGGGQIYHYCLENDLIDVMYITEVRETFEADVYFSEFNESDWNKELIMEHPIDEKHKHAFDIYRYRRKR